MALLGNFLRRHASDTPCLKHVILFSNVTSFNDAVTSYVMSQHHMCIGHMTVYYKRGANTSMGEVSVISTRPRSAALLPVSTASTGLLRLLVGAQVHHVRSDTGNHHMWT